LATVSQYDPTVGEFEKFRYRRDNLPGVLVGRTKQKFLDRANLATPESSNFNRKA
jgi:hypothetical protein